MAGAGRGSAIFLYLREILAYSTPQRRGNFHDNKVPQLRRHATHS